jgi:hypothetical protein
MAPRKQRHSQLLQEVILADDDLLDLVQNAFHWHDGCRVGLFVHWSSPPEPSLRRTDRSAGG